MAITESQIFKVCVKIVIKMLEEINNTDICSFPQLQSYQLGKKREMFFCC